MDNEELKALEELLGDLAPQHDSPEAVDAMLWDLDADDDDEEYLEYLAEQEAFHAAHGADASHY
jgi:heat shock protein HspQ